MFEFKQKRFRCIVHLLLTLLVMYVLLALFVMLMQRKLIYFPTRFAPAVATHLAQQEGYIPWHNGAGETIGWRRPAKRAATASVLVLHGNGGSAAQRGYLASPIHSAGDIDVFVLEYPGYGAREGVPGMRSFLAAAENAFGELPTNRPVYLVSESLGTGVAAHIAKKHRSRVSGLLLFAPYDDLASVGQNQMKIFPVKLLMRDRFKPAEWLKDYRGPIKVVLAEADTIIPTRFGQKLYDSYRGPKSVEVIRGAGHNDIAAQSPEWWKSVFSFWEQKRVQN